MPLSNMHGHMALALLLTGGLYLSSKAKYSDPVSSSEHGLNLATLYHSTG